MPRILRPFHVFLAAACLAGSGFLLVGCQQVKPEEPPVSAAVPEAGAWKGRQSQVQPYAARCMAGISEVALASRADHIRLEGFGAFPVAGVQLSKRGWRFPAAASQEGERRAVAIGIEHLEPGNAAQLRLLRNSLAWLGEGLASPRIGLVGDGAGEWLTACEGLPAMAVGRKELDGCSLLVVAANSLSEAQLEALERWVANRPLARLLCLGRADTWAMQALGTAADGRGAVLPLEAAENFPGNRVLRPFGLAFGGVGVAGAWKSPWSAGWSMLQVPSWSMALLGADERERAALSPEEFQSLSLGVSALAPVFRTSPEKAKALAAKIMPLVDRCADGKMNVAKDPWGGLYASVFCELARTLPADSLPVPACVKVFPGLPASPERLGQTQVEIDLSVPRWHSTGIYAAPGEVVTVSLPAELAASGAVGIQVGCHTDNIRPRSPNLDRFPVITRYWRVSGPATQVACAFGGPVYLDVRQPGAGKAVVKLDGGVAMPIYRAGDSTEAWKSVRQAPAPWAEFQGKNLVITVPAQVARTLDNPGEILAFWDKVVSVQDDFCGYTRRTSPERYVYDRQISAGWMHSGYPLMAFDKAAQDMFNLETLRKDGNWGCFHEIGHNHQELFGCYENAWTFDGNVEVTVNIFSAYTYVKALGFETPNAHNYWNSANLQANFAKAYKPGTVYGQGSHLYRSLFFAHLAAEFGWESLGRCLSSYWDLKPAEMPTDNLGKRSLFLVRMSRTVGYNLAPLFAAWGLETTEASRRQVAVLPAYAAYKYPLPGMPAAARPAAAAEAQAPVSAEASPVRETAAVVAFARYDIESAILAKDAQYFSTDQEDARLLYARLLGQAPVENASAKFTTAFQDHVKAWVANDEDTTMSTWEIMSQVGTTRGVPLSAFEMELLK